MTDQSKFEGPNKLPKTTLGAFCRHHRIKLNSDLDVDDSVSLPEGLEILFQKRAVTEFFLIFSTALPARERVWYACLAARDMLPEGAEKTPP